MADDKNPYQSDSTPGDAIFERSVAPLTWVLTALASVAVLASGVAYGFVVPSFRAMFEELGDPLPALTQAIVGIPPPLWYVAGILGFLLLVLKNFVLKKSGRILIDTVALVCAGGSIFVMIIALFLPLIDIIKTVG